MRHGLLNILWITDDPDDPDGIDDLLARSVLD